MGHWPCRSMKSPKRKSSDIVSDDVPKKSVAKIIRTLFYKAKSEEGTEYQNLSKKTKQEKKPEMGTKNSLKVKREPKWWNKMRKMQNRV